MEHAEGASQAKDMLTAALAAVLRNHAGFDRRVVRRLFQLDFQILLLGKNAPNKCCEERKVVARCLLREENLFVNASQNQNSLQEGTGEAAVTGELDNRVQDHKLFAELSSRMEAEMLPIDDGAPEATCAFAVHHSPQVGRYE